MDPKKRFFLKNGPFFRIYETSSWIPTSHRFMACANISGHWFCPKVPSRAVCYVVMPNWDLSSLWINTSTTFISFFLDKEESYHLIGVGKTCPQLYNQNSWAMMDVYSGSGQVRATLSCPRLALTFALPPLRSNPFLWNRLITTPQHNETGPIFVLVYHKMASEKTLDLKL